MRIRVTGIFVALATVFGQTQQSFQAQAPADDVTIRINVNLVQVDAVVVDSKDRPVTDLKAADFEILQDGKPQIITNFGYISTGTPRVATVPVVQAKKGTPAAPPPPPTRLKASQIRRTVAMVVDDLGLSFESIARVRQSLKKFVDEQMQPGDLVAVIRTGAGMGALQQFTADKRMLYAAIDRVKFNAFGRVSIGTFARYGDEVDANTRFDEFRETMFSVGTLGAIRYVVDGLRELPGRKSVLLFSENMRMFNSEGSNAQVMESMRQLTDSANRASVVIYSIDPRGLETLQMSAAESGRDMNPQQLAEDHGRRVQAPWESQEGMNFLATETGGIFFKDDNDINAGVRRVMEDQQGYYLIGYHPDASTFDEKSGRRLFHSVKVKVKRAGLHVRSRNGFYGVSDSDQRPGVGQSRDAQLQHALVSPFGAAGVGLHLTTLFSHLPKPIVITPPQPPQKKNAPPRALPGYKVDNFINSLLHIEAKDLNFLDINEPSEKDPKIIYTKKAEIDLLVITFGDNGIEVDRSNVTYRLRMPDAIYKEALKGGFIYTVRHPIRKPGAYQLRVALRDANSGKVGSASQFIEVPDVGKGRLLLSGLVLKGEDPRNRPANPDQPATIDQEPDPQSGAALRIFKPGRALTYGYQVLNAHPGPDKVPQLQVQTRLFREGQKVYEGKPMPFNPVAQPDPKNLVAGGRLQLGPKMTPGDYVLQVIVTDNLAKDAKYRTATQWQTFEVVQP